MASHLPPAFLTSIQSYENYPENLTHQTTYHGVLRTYKSHLDDKEKAIFTSKAFDINVPFRDLIGPGLGEMQSKGQCCPAYRAQVLKNVKYRTTMNSRNDLAAHGS